MGEHKAFSSFVQSGLQQQVEQSWKVETNELLSDDNKCTSVDDRKALAIHDGKLSYLPHYPIMTVSGDVKDQEPLTPNHLLLLKDGPTLPP